MCAYEGSTYVRSECVCTNGMSHSHGMLPYVLSFCKVKEKWRFFLCKAIYNKSSQMLLSSSPLSLFISLLAPLAFIALLIAMDSLIFLFFLSWADLSQALVLSSICYAIRYARAQLWQTSQYGPCWCGIYAPSFVVSPCAPSARCKSTGNPRIRSRTQRQLCPQQGRYPSLSS